jgi:hypothetical protein
VTISSPAKVAILHFLVALTTPLAKMGLKRDSAMFLGQEKTMIEMALLISGLIYIPRGPIPIGGFPIMIYAHAAGQTASDLCYNADQMNMSDIVCVIWESVTENTRTSTGLPPPIPLYYSSADSDFQNVLLWVRNQAENQTNIDLNLDKVYVSGGSRGTRISFKELTSVQSANTNTPFVKGVIFSQAFPDPEWRLAEDYNLPNPIELVEADYPPVLFLYSTFPGQIVEIHDPLNGMNVLEELNCQGVATSLYYGNTHGLFSEAMRPELLDFIENPELFISNLEEQVIDGDAPIPALTLFPPKNVTLKISPNDPGKFKVTWKENDWSSIISQPPYLACELRAINVEEEDFCQAFYEQQVYISSVNNGINIPSLFSYPNSFINACNLPSNLSPGASYDVQVRCFVRIPGLDSFGTNTPWSEPVTVTLPLCNELRASDQINSAIELENNGENRYAILDLENALNIYQIYDLTGRTVLQGRAQGRIELDLNHLSHGLYVLRLSKPDGTTNQISLFKK